MIGLVLLVGAVAAILLWVLETAPSEPHGIDSFPCPPPIPCSCPREHFTATLDGAPHVAPCAFADPA